ncbi:DUF4190 domain-containing protein [Thermobifida halotolerans]|uniref:DUF4190 domain-containing protein n=1 Tax=Thermobifida halotolerans TaxID=483545 RepID=A0A399G2Q0_9ACTN|nr:hypothetical protein [Thermobifida halotolerans]UOE18292.1 DUF4190 domain-containing protein [Thermobifida halotolerans]
MNGEPSAPQPEGQQATVERGGLWGLMLSIAGLLLLPFSAVLSVIGIVQGARARRNAKSRGGQAPGAVLSIVVGAVGVLWGLLVTVGLVVFFDELTAYSQCSARANTVSAQEECDDAYAEAISERFPDQPWVRELVENNQVSP